MARRRIPSCACDQSAEFRVHEEFPERFSLQAGQVAWRKPGRLHQGQEQGILGDVLTPSQRDGPKQRFDRQDNDRARADGCGDEERAPDDGPDGPADLPESAAMLLVVFHVNFLLWHAGHDLGHVRLLLAHAKVGENRLAKFLVGTLVSAPSLALVALLRLLEQLPEPPLTVRCSNEP
jgi:hypothetical protein